jgi:uncharacterized protein
MLRLAGLYIHPVKSLRGCAVTEVQVDELGPVGDRRFLVVDATGKFLTQRTHPRMACVATALTVDTLALSADGHGGLQVPRFSPPGSPTRTVTVWKSEGLVADDCGDAVAEWLSSFLATAVRMVRIGKDFTRPVKPAKAKPGDVVSFADGYPFLLIGQASLDHLNDRLQENGADPVPMNRFRPNLVVTGGTPFAEDGWAHFRIGGVTFRNAGLCARCIVTTTDQQTGERTGPEPLRTLATFRRDAADPTDVNFGINLVNETKQGVLRIGDAVEVL